VQKVWTKIEDRIFPQLKYTYTVCQTIADTYNKRYGINMQVVRNIPFAAEETSATGRVWMDTKGKKVLLYQGAVNVGRGIEWIINTMPYLKDFVCYIVGGGDLLEKMKALVKTLRLEDRVFFTGRLPFEALSAYTQCADIGINLLDNRGLNYYYSLPNRIFDYIRNSVPVLTSDFPEIRKIVAHYDIGTLVDHYEPEYLAEIIRQMSKQEKNTAGFARANAELTWENEAQTLLKIIQNASLSLRA
jgi:glycosyltransferase involved in cell wall biosynthesis